VKFSIHVRCDCADPDTGKPLGQKCPRLWRADGSWNSRHGKAGWAARIPVSGGTRLVKRYTYKSKAEAEAAAKHVGKLLDLAADDLTRARIGDLVVTVKRNADLPAVEDVRRRLGLGLDPGKPGMTVGGWADAWLAGKQRTRRASTARGYESHIRLYIKPVIGTIPLERVNPGHVEAVLAAVDASPSTKHRVLATIRAALSAAVKARQIQWNPCMAVELMPENPAEAATWTPAQARQFIDATAADPLGLAFRVALLTGVRRGELLGLTWACADLESGVLSIERTLLELGGKLTEGRPKTRAGERRVYLGPETAALLRKHRETQELEQQFAGEGWQDHGLIFCRSDGTPWRPDYVSKRFRALAAQAGLPPIKLHSARHSAISAMRAAGVDRDLRKRAAGHSDDEVHDKYTHFWDDALRDAASQAEGFTMGGGTT
jgi:integrase